MTTPTPPAPASKLSPFIEVTIVRGGIYLPEADLWLDPHHSVPLAVVTHAHADHVARHQEIIASPGTCHLLRARYSHKSKHRPLAFQETLNLGKFTLQLLPAGHVLGSAMALLTRVEDGSSLLYTGDFKTEPGLCGELLQTARADLLIMECTFGKPLYTFPPREETCQRILHWCRDALEAGQTPILLGYSLGKAQELLAIFAGSGLPIAVHATVGEMCRAYQKLGQTFPPFTILDENTPAQSVIITPPQTLTSPPLPEFTNKLTATATGWALMPSARFQQGVDAQFPLSDHAGYPDLLAFVEQVQPRRILTTHGFSEDFAQDLRQRGWDAWTLAGNDQPDLPFGPSPTSPAAPSTVSHAFPVPTASPWTAFCDTVTALAKLPARREKLQALLHYFQTLTEEELPLAANFLTHQSATPTNWPTIRLAIRLFSNFSEAAYRQLDAIHSHPAQTAEAVLQQTAEQGLISPMAWALEKIAKLLSSQRHAPSSLEKTQHLATLFAQFHPREARIFAQVLTGDILRDIPVALVEEALATTVASPLESIHRAHGLTGDLAEITTLALQGRLPDARTRLFHPVHLSAFPFPLTSPQNLPAQLHLGPGRAELLGPYNQNLAPQHPEILSTARKWNFHGIVLVEISPPPIPEQLPEGNGNGNGGGDGVGNGEGDGKTNLKAKAKAKAKSKTKAKPKPSKAAADHPDLFAPAPEPIPWHSRDLLLLNGQSLHELPQAERQALLQEKLCPPPLVPLPTKMPEPATKAKQKRKTPL